MTGAELARLEALRTTALAALTSARAVVQTIDAMLMTGDAPEAVANVFDTFDTEPTPPNAIEVTNDRQSRR